MNTEILEQIGLSRNEIKVYFALLELDQSSATPIVKKADIPNSKVYQTIEKLIKKGLASYVIKNNVKYFQASDPKHLIGLLSEKEEQIIQQKQEIGKLIPQIELKRKFAEEKQEAVVYESFDGIKAAFNVILDSLNPGEEYLVFMLGEALKEKQVIRFFQNYHKKRVEKAIKARLISHVLFKDIVKRQHMYKGMKARFTNQKLPIGTFIFKNHVMTVVWEEKPTAFVIKSRKNYECYKEFFDEIWKTAKP